MSSRPAIPKPDRDRVLSEYRHRCAICGGDKPQLHHIDHDPRNNGLMNLIPLCPNDHLSDQHDPTRGLDPRLLSLFRRYKDPAILKPQFHPIFVRCLFLGDLQSSTNPDEVEARSEELVEFVASLEMGDFYAKQLGRLLRKPRHAGFWVPGDPESDKRLVSQSKKHDQEYIEQCMTNRGHAESLLVEILRFQKW
jgi:hypothetical protein